VSDNRPSDVQNENEAPAAPLRPRRWLVAQASALLQAVAATNYACYGSAGVPRYGVQPPPRQPKDASTLCAELMVRSPQGEVRLAWIDLDLEPVQHSDRQVVWSAYDPARRLQVLWVWDFYRILSHVVLRGGLPPAPDVTPDAPWRATLDALRAAAPGDQIALKVQSACGNIHQLHTLERPAAEWEPAADVP
jgi:hypothetical protein